MTKTRDWYQRALANCAGIYGQLLIKTLRIQAIDLTHYLELKKAGENVILVMWHSRMLLVAHHGSRFGIATLVSPSRDGDIGARVAARLGIKTVRGDSQHQPGRVLMSLAHTLRSGNDIAVFPDGPLGPAVKVKPGVLALAQLTRCTIVPVGADARWKITFKRSWDRFLLPLPFSKVCVVIGQPLRVLKSTDQNYLNEKAENLAEQIDNLTQQAQRLCQE